MSNTSVSIKKNYLYNTLYQILLMVTPLITAPYISRVLGSAGVGIYSYTNSVVTYFTLFAALGTASYGQREIAMHRDNKEECSKLFWEIEILSIVTTGIVTIAWLLWTCVRRQYSIYYLILTVTVIATAFDISWYYAGFELFKYIVIRNTMVKLAGIILLFIFVKNRNNVGIYIGIMAATGLFGNLSMWTYLPKMLSKVNYHNLRPFKHFKQTLAYFIPTIATSVYTVLDKTMIGAITKSSEQNGYYEQATKIVRMIESLVFSLNSVMASRQSYLFAINKYDEIKDKINKSFDILFGITIATMFGIQGVAENFVPWFFGKGYEPVVYLLYVMAPLPFVICISNILGSQYLTPSGQRVRSSKGIIAGAIVNFILNSVMIPKFASIGAAIASVMAEAVISIIFLYMSKEYITWKFLVIITWKKFVAGIFMLFMVIEVGKIIPNKFIITFIQIISGTIIYALILYLLKDSLLSAFLQAVKKKNN